MHVVDGELFFFFELVLIETTILASPFVNPVPRPQLPAYNQAHTRSPRPPATIMHKACWPSSPSPPKPQLCTASPIHPPHPFPLASPSSPPSSHFPRPARPDTRFQTTQFSSRLFLCITFFSAKIVELIFSSPLSLHPLYSIGFIYFYLLQVPLTLPLRSVNRFF